MEEGQPSIRSEAVLLLSSQFEILSPAGFFRGLLDQTLLHHVRDNDHDSLRHPSSRYTVMEVSLRQSYHSKEDLRRI